MRKQATTTPGKGSAREISDFLLHPTSATDELLGVPFEHDNLSLRERSVTYRDGEPGSLFKRRRD